MAESSFYFTVNSNLLLKELLLLEPLTSRTTAVAVTSFVAMEVTDDGLFISATDTSSTLVTHCPLEGFDNTGGGVLLPAKELTALIKEFKNANLLFIINDKDFATISIAGSKKSKYTIPGLSIDKMMAARRLQTEYVHSMPASQMVTHITKTKWAIPKDNDKPNLKCMELKLTNTDIQTVSLDGQRVPIVLSKALFPVEAPVTMRIPEQALGDVMRLAGDADKNQPLWIGQEGNHLFFKIGNREFSTTTVAGDLPNYNSLLTSTAGNDKKVELSRGLFVEALRKASLMADKKNPAIRLILKPSFLEIKGASKESNMQGEENLDVEYNGDEIEIGFHVKNLMEFLNSSQAEHVRMELLSPDRIALFYTVGEEISTTYLTAPTRIL